MNQTNSKKKNKKKKREVLFSVSIICEFYCFGSGFYVSNLMLCAVLLPFESDLHIWKK